MEENVIQIKSGITINVEVSVKNIMYEKSFRNIYIYTFLLSFMKFFVID